MSTNSRLVAYINFMGHTNLDSRGMTGIIPKGQGSTKQNCNWVVGKYQERKKNKKNES